MNRNLPTDSAKKELGSALQSVLGDLKVRYMNLKEKVRTGTPLEELPPLSVEARLLSAFSDFASGVCICSRIKLLLHSDRKYTKSGFSLFSANERRSLQVIIVLSSVELTCS